MQHGMVVFAIRLSASAEAAKWPSTEISSTQSREAETCVIRNKERKEGRGSSQRLFLEMNGGIPYSRCQCHVCVAEDNYRLYEKE